MRHRHGGVAPAAADHFARRPGVLQSAAQDQTRRMCSKMISPNLIDAAFNSGRRMPRLRHRAPPVSFRRRNPLRRRRSPNRRRNRSSRSRRFRNDWKDFFTPTPKPEPAKPAPNRGRTRTHKSRSNLTRSFAPRRNLPRSNSKPEQELEAVNSRNQEFAAEFIAGHGG